MVETLTRPAIFLDFIQNNQRADGKVSNEHKKSHKIEDEKKIAQPPATFSHTLLGPANCLLSEPASADLCKRPQRPHMASSLKAPSGFAGGVSGAPAPRGLGCFWVRLSC